MANQDNLERIFGPYKSYPFVYISYSETASSLKRIIYEEEPGVPAQVQKPKNEEDEDNNKMTWKQVFLYYLFLYTPPKESEFKPQSRIMEKIVGEEVLCKSTTGFEVIQKPEGYYVHAKIRNP